MCRRLIDAGHAFGIQAQSDLERVSELLCQDQWPRFSTSDDLVKIGLVCVEWTPPAKTSEESLLFVGVRRSNEIAGRELKHEVALGVGAAALLSAVPGLGVLEVVVGLLQIAWFLWFGISTARIGSKESHAAVA